MNGRFKKVNCFLQPITAIGISVIMMLANAPVRILIHSGKLKSVESVIITISLLSITLLLAITVLCIGFFATKFALKSYKTTSATEFELQNTYIYVLDYLNFNILLFTGIFSLIMFGMIAYYASLFYYTMLSFSDFIPMLIYFLIFIFGLGVSFIIAGRTKKLNKIAPE